MKARNLTAIALALLLGAHAVGCSDDGGPEQTNNSLADAGDDTGIHDTGDEDADLADVGEDTADDVGEPDVADGGDIGVDTDLDTGVDADLDTDADADAGDPPPPPDDVDPLGGYWSEDYSVAGLVGPDGGVVDALLHNETTDEIYAAGGFTYAGTTEVTNIARWDGTQWQALGNGLQISVYALAQDAGGTLYAAGSGGGGFIGPSSNDMYSWDGTQWTNFASAAPGSSKIYDMVALSNGDLIVAGDFSGIEGVQANNVARWDGTNWTAIDANNEPDDRVYDITETGEGFCIGGYFENIGSTAAKGVACWNGTAWAQAGSGIDGRVHALHSIGGSELLAAGQFRLDGAYGLAKFDGTSWQGHLGGVAGGMVTDVRMLHEGPSGEIYVGGTFDYVGPSRTYSANIAKIDGGNWTALDTGVREKSRFTTGSVVGVNAAVSLNNGDLVVGGFFTNASDAFAPNLATWDDTSWSTLVNTDRPYLGADATVSTYASGPNGELYAGGWFGHIGPNGTPRVPCTTARPGGR